MYSLNVRLFPIWWNKSALLSDVLSPTDHCAQGAECPLAKKKKKGTKEYKQNFLNIECRAIKSFCSLNLLEGLSHNGSYFKKEENAVNFQNLCLTFGNGTINRLILLSLKKMFLTKSYPSTLLS